MEGQGAELVTRGDALLARPVIDQMDERKLTVIRSSVAKGTSDAELAMFLELAAHLQLSPFTGEIWCSKSQGRDGKEGKLMIMVGRDGLLKNAERYPDYLGYDSGVVRDSDIFERVDPDPEGRTLRLRAGVVHRPAHPREAGEILGAWCVAERADRPPRYFYAPLSEYMPVFDADWKLKKSPWGNQTSVMIEKVALSVVHRTLCGITGVHVPEEMERIVQEDRPEVIVDPLARLEDPDARAAAREALRVIRAENPEAYPDAKLDMVLSGSAENQHAFVQDLLRGAAALVPADAEVLPDPPEGEGEGDEPGAPEGVPGPSPEPDQAVLRLRAEGLEGRIRSARGEEERGALIEELEGVEASLRRLGGENPSQGALSL